MGYADFTDDRFSSYYLRNNDILMSHINSPIHVGKTALCDIKDMETIIHGMNLLCLMPLNNINPSYINFFFSSNCFHNQIHPFIRKAVNQASINIQNLSIIPFPLPPLAEQKRIVAKIEELFAQIELLKQ